MAGKRQHYVPRLLQRGFLHDPTEEAERTWLHRRGSKPKLVGIADIGVEDWFYSRRSVDGSPTLDDLITELEQEFCKVVNIMRATAPGAVVDSDVAAQCVVHLVMRTDHLRRVMSEGVASLASEIEQLFTDSSRLSTMIGFNKPELSQRVMEKIRKSALELSPTGIPPSLSERLMSVLIRENGTDLANNAAVSLAPLFPMLFGDLASMVRDAHKRILEIPPETNGWVARLSNFNWTVEAGTDLILPDAVALAAEADGRLVPLLFSNGNDTRAVVMSIARDLALVGIAVDQIAFDLNCFNEQAAAACSAFFIGAHPFEAENLAALIGSGPSTAILSAVGKAVSDVETKETASRSRPLPTTGHWKFEQRDFSYSVRLADFGDVAHSKELNEIIQSVVNELSRRLPLYELDGFTLAWDYGKALAELDRGHPSLPAAASEALEYGVGVAKPVTVCRDGARKEHIVLSARLAESWLSDDPEARAFGLNILVKMLAIVAHTSRFAEDAAITFKPDPLTAELHIPVATTPSGWFSARESAFVAPHLGGAYAQLLMESLEFAEREIESARATSKATGDISHVTRRAMECISAILTHAADWLGHRAGLTEGQAFEGDDLAERLQSRGLDRWLELFGRDLAAIYEHEDAGLNTAVIGQLSQHVDRLLWFLGIFAWLDGDDVRCLVTDKGLVVPPLNPER